MQRDKNLLHINNGQQIDAIQASTIRPGLCVYTRRYRLVQIHPDQPPIRLRAWGPVFTQQINLPLI